MNARVSLTILIFTLTSINASEPPPFVVSNANCQVPETCSNRACFSEIKNKTAQALTATWSKLESDDARSASPFIDNILPRTTFNQKSSIPLAGFGFIRGFRTEPGENIRVTQENFREIEQQMAERIAQQPINIGVVKFFNPASPEKFLKISVTYVGQKPIIILSNHDKSLNRKFTPPMPQAPVGMRVYTALLGAVQTPTFELELTIEGENYEGSQLVGLTDQ